MYSLDSWLEYEKKSIFVADSVIVTCQEMKSRLIGMHGINPSKIFPVHNTEDPSDWNNLEFPVRRNKILEKDTISLIYGGSCSLHRGLDVAIHGMVQLVEKFNNIRLDIIGDGPGVRVWTELVMNLGLQDQVKFHGQLPFIELKKRMAEADIGIIPHHKYGQTDNTIPHKLYQHFGAALPSLVSSCHSLQNAIVQTGAGKVFNAGDPHHFARITIEMIQDLHHGSDFSENSKKALYNGEYSWHTSETNLNDAYLYAFSGKNLKAT
jgi:glycosyltransferase involved in cell wall biosynthesis